jgi:hypothetical protein
MKRSGDKRLAVLGAKDHVRQEVCVGVGQVLSPLRGGGVLLEFLTHLRHGLRSFALFAGCEAGSVLQRLGGEMPAYHGWREAQFCGLCSFRLHATPGFALRQPRVGLKMIVPPFQGSGGDGDTVDPGRWPGLL